jgi:hypothetical protein
MQTGRTSPIPMRYSSARSSRISSGRAGTIPGGKAVSHARRGQLGGPSDCGPSLSRSTGQARCTPERRIRLRSDPQGSDGQPLLRPAHGPTPNDPGGRPNSFLDVAGGRVAAGTADPRVVGGRRGRGDRQKVVVPGGAVATAARWPALVVALPWLWPQMRCSSECVETPDASGVAAAGAPATCPGTRSGDTPLLQ